jgi:hypothetical protein
MDDKFFDFAEFLEKYEIPKILENRQKKQEGSKRIFCEKSKRGPKEFYLENIRISTLLKSNNKREQFSTF